jgi:tRNA(fMet)-specific endonuclease VapC
MIYMHVLNRGGSGVRSPLDAWENGIYSRIGHGQTLGKRLMHIRVVDRSGEPIGMPKALARYSAIPPSLVCVCVVTRAELQYGLKRLPAGHRLHVGVHRFLSIVCALSWDAEAADAYADIRHQLVSTGQPIGEMDMMIAAHSLAARAALVTHNVRHYERIPGLVLANWSEE